MKVKEESEKVGLKLNIQKTKIMASGPITSWQIDGETVETVADFIFWGPKSLQMVTVAMKLKDARHIVIFTKTKQCGKKEPQTPVSSSGTLDFLSAYLVIDSQHVIILRFPQDDEHAEAL